MAQSELASNKPVTIDNGVLSFNKEGDYSFNFLSNGKVQVLLAGGATTVLTAQQWASVTTFNVVKAESDLGIDASLLVGKTITGAGDLEIAGLNFHDADASGRFETSHNLDTAIGSMINARGVEATLASLSVNGDAAGAFKLLWDYLDDGYAVPGNENYYNISLNESFVRLGVEYTKYLAAGGSPLTDVTAKFTADGADASSVTDREQSMHDNLLGNLNTGAVDDRFSSNPAKLAELKALIPDEYEIRGVFSGDEFALGGTAHDSARAFDYDKGWARTDYIDKNADGTVDARAQDANGLEMRYGDGNTTDGWNIVRHEGAGVELALKVKHRGGSDYDVASIDDDGVAHYHVAEGTAAGSTTRAEWNFDFAATKLAAGDDETFTFKLLVDRDATAGVNLVEYVSGDNPTGYFQNSVNYGFIDTDLATAGTQSYGFADGQFDVVLQAFDGETLVAQNKIVVHVGDLYI